MRPAIRVDGLSKLYQVGARQQGYRTLRESIADAFWSPLRKLRKRSEGRQASAVRGQESGVSGQPTAPNPKSEIRNPKSPAPRLSGEHFWALKDVSFDVQPGEVVGIIGRNGAGKSTLLKILSRITEPTSGRIELRGRVGSLLEVGTGFHPELTGRENIYMNGSILGMSRREIHSKFDEIVSFAEIEDFLDTPVKRYSSGMYVRLAFAVAAHLEPEILIVDEVLAVGDAAFQRKCMGKLHDVAEAGRTVFFVSHNLAAVENLCTRALVLIEGGLELDSDPRSAVAAYLRHSEPSEHSCDTGAIDLFTHKYRRPGCDAILAQLSITTPDSSNGTVVQTGGTLTFHIDFKSIVPRGGYSIAIFVCHSGQRLLMFHNKVNSLLSVPRCTKGTVVCQIDSLPLVPGIYDIELALDSDSGFDYIERAASMQVVEADFLSTGLLPKPTQAKFVHAASWSLIDVI